MLKTIHPAPSKDGANLIVNMERMGLYQIINNSDEVVATAPIPPGGKMVQVQGSVHVQPIAAIAIDSMLVYALHGYILPMPRDELNRCLKSQSPQIAPAISSVRYLPR